MAAPRKKAYAVFLSHSHHDNWLADVIAHKFKAAGADVWLDEMSLTGGDEVLAGIVKGIRSCNETVVLVSNESIKSQWVAAEIGMAVAARKRITGLLNNVDFDAMAPLSSIKSYALNDFQKLIRDLRKRLATWRR